MKDDEHEYVPQQQRPFISGYQRLSHWTGDRRLRALCPGHYYWKARSGLQIRPHYGRKVEKERVFWW